MTKHSNYNAKEKHCYICNVLLNDSNTYESQRKCRNYICMSCTKTLQNEQRKLVKDYIITLTDDEFLELIVRRHYETS